MADTTMTTGKTVENKEEAFKRECNYGALYYAALVVFVITISFIHLPLGGDRQWIVALAFLLIYITLALYLLRSYSRGYFKCTFSTAYILFGILILCSLIQINLSCGNISLLKNNYDVWKALAQYLSEDIYSPISLTPSLSLSYLFLFCLSSLVFYMSIELFRRKQVFLLLPAIFLFSIVLNAFVGFFNQTGIMSARIFSYIPPRGISVAGTFVNRNHFAVFIEMGLFTSLGLFIGAYLSRSVKYKRALMTFSSIVFSFLLVSILFSYSRAGISISIFLLLVFSVFLIIELRKRRRLVKSIYFFMLFGLAFFLAAIRGLTYVWDRYETTFFADDPSMMGRFDFWKTTMDMIKEYWVMGSGFGSFTYVSTRFESGFIPNKIANHAHNDWLELFAETGVPFATLIIALILYLYISTLIKVFKQKDTFRRWLGLGAGVSILSVMLHETVGFALRKPGIMVLFAVLAVIFIRCASDPREKKIRFRGASGIVCLSVSMVLLAFLFVKTIPFVTSGYALEYLNDRYRAYYPLHTNRPDYEDAEYKIELADKVLASQPSPIAYMVKGQAQYTIAHEILERDGFRVNNKNREIIKRNLEEAIENIQISLHRYPTRSLYYIRLANCMEFLLELEMASSINKDLSEQENKLEKTLEIAHYYSPNIANITGNVAMGKWRRIVRRLQKGKPFALTDDDVKVVIDLFRKYAIQSPAYSYEIYNLIWASVYSPQLLRSVTPDYTSAHVNLYKFFVEKGLYSDAEKQLDKILEIQRKFNQGEHAQYDLIRRTRISDEELKKFVYSEKATLSAAKGDWNAYRKDTFLYRKNLRVQLDKELDRLRKLFKNHHYHIVHAKLQHLLRQDPEYDKTLFLAAFTSLKLGKVNDLKKHIISLLMSKDQTNKDSYKRLLAQLEKLNIFSEREQGLLEFYRNGIRYKIISSSSGSGVDKKALSEVKDKFSEIIKLHENKKYDWLNFHLVYFFQAETLKLGEDYNRALEAYLKALRHTPRALFVIKATKDTLSDMERKGIEIDTSTKKEFEAYFRWAEDLKPDSVTNIDFGNKIELYGISVSKDPIKQMDTVMISYYFECRNIIDRDYFINLVFVNNAQPRVQEHFQPGFNQDGEAMLTWKVGEIIEIKRKIQPAIHTLKTYNSNPPTGNYLLDLSFYSLGVDSRVIKPVVKTPIPVFRIEL